MKTTTYKNVFGVLSTLSWSKYGKLFKSRSYKVSVILSQGHRIRLPIKNYPIMLNSICAIFSQSFTMIFNQIMILYCLNSLTLCCDITQNIFGTEKYVSPEIWQRKIKSRLSWIYIALQAISRLSRIPAGTSMLIQCYVDLTSTIYVEITLKIYLNLKLE